MALTRSGADLPILRLATSFAFKMVDRRWGIPHRGPHPYAASIPSLAIFVAENAGRLGRWLIARRRAPPAGCAAETRPETPMTHPHNVKRENPHIRPEPSLVANSSFFAALLRLLLGRCESQFARSFAPRLF